MKKFIKEDDSHLNSLITSFPATIPLFSFFIFIIFNNFDALIFSLSILLIEVINFFLKNYFENLCIKKGSLNNDNSYSLPILGRCQRPSNYKNYKCFLKKNFKSNLNEIGMPSGHIQTIVFIVSLIIQRYLIKDIKNINTKIKIFILLLLVVYTGYTRIYVYNCHTIEQVVLGGIFGFIFSIIINFIFKSFN